MWYFCTKNVFQIPNSAIQDAVISVDNEAKSDKMLLISTIFNTQTFTLLRKNTKY